MHQQPPKIPLLRSTSAANAGQVDGSRAQIGVRVSDPELDFDQAQKNKEGIVSGLVNGITGVVKANGITIVNGRGAFTGPNTIAVEGGEDVTFRSAVIATGSHSLRPPVKGIEAGSCV